MIIHSINNLRLISVLLVLLYHYFPGRVPGGLIGVDIFFFISGYLMARLIEGNEVISAWSFLKKRIDRLFPALLIYIIFVILVYSLLLFPQQKAEFLKNIISSITFMKNLQLSSADTYFVGNKFDDPTLILWSLSVEFQVYLIFSFILLIAKSYFKRCIILLTSISLIYFCFNHFYGNDNFYALQSRFWQMGIGAMAYFYLSSSVLSFNKYIKLLGTIISVTGITYLSVYHVSDLTWPSLDVFILLFFVGTIVTLNMNSMYPSSKVYPLTYELYMYHWVFLCLGVQLLNISTILKIGLLFCSVVVSYLANYIVKYSSYKALTLISIFSLITFYSSPGFMPLSDYQKVLAQSDFPQSCKQDMVCVYGDTRAQKLLIMGDSHAEVLSHSLYVGGVENTLARIRGCDFIIDSTCLEKISSSVQGWEFDNIIISVCTVCNNPSFDLEKSKFFLKSLLKLRESYSDTIIVVSDNPVGEQFDPRNHLDPDPVEVPNEYFNYVADQKYLFEKNGFVFLDLNKYLCNGKCVATLDGRFLYSDADHLRPWVLQEYGVIDNLIKLTQSSYN